MANEAGVAIVGTGLSAMACAKALVGRGIKVTILDAGEELSDDRKAAVASMKWTAPDQWQADERALVTENRTVHSEDIPQKLAFGSDYVYARNRFALPMSGGFEKSLSFTFGKGGFSTVWGGAMLPMADCDMAAWPLRRGDMEAHYRNVLSTLPLSAMDDGIAKEFPLYVGGGPTPVSLTPSMAAMLDTFKSAGKSLAEKNIVAGMARLAIHAKATPTTPGCDGCGLCLTGCPRGAIYNSWVDIEAMIAAGDIRYLSGVAVEKVDESATKVSVSVVHLSDKSKEVMEFERIFVGAGPINSARIVLNSLALFETPLKMLESQKFILPFLRLKGNPAIFDEQGVSLPNGLVVVKADPAVDHWSQIQLSPANEMVFQKLNINTATLSGPLKWALATGLGRLIIGWGSVHSDQSSYFSIKLLAKKVDGYAPLDVQAHENPAFKPTYKAISRKLLANSATLKMVPLAPLARLSPPGHGNHYGGIFPMHEKPVEKWHTDRLGRPGGLQRLHIIDSAIFPSVPGTTIALVLMANASRIACEAPIGE